MKQVPDEHNARELCIYKLNNKENKQQHIEISLNLPSVKKYTTAVEEDVNADSIQQY